MLTTSKSYYMKLPFVKNGPKHHNANEVVLHSTYVTVKVGNLERRNQIVVTVGKRIQIFSQDDAFQKIFSPFICFCTTYVKALRSVHSVTNFFGYLKNYGTKKYSHQSLSMVQKNVESLSRCCIFRTRSPQSRCRQRQITLGFGIFGYLHTYRSCSIDLSCDSRHLSLADSGLRSS